MIEYKLKYAYIFTFLGPYENEEESETARTLDIHTCNITNIITIHFNWQMSG